MCGAENPGQKAESKGKLGQEMKMKLGKVMRNQVKFWGKKEQRHMMWRALINVVKENSMEQSMPESKEPGSQAAPT